MPNDMPEWIQISMTAAFTLLGGIVLLIASELIKLLIVVPLKKYRDQVEVIIDKLDYHANYITNFFSEDPSPEEKELMQQIRRDFRAAATQLNAVYASISYKKLLIRTRLVPNKEEVRTAFRSLIFISNNLPRVSRERGGRDQITQNSDAIDKIKESLHRETGN